MDTVAADELIAVLQDAIAGKAVDEARIAAFGRHTTPQLADEARFARFAATHVDELVALAADPRDALRHLALFALGFSDDARSVEPLLDRLVDSIDFFDHDHCYASLGRLGELAFEPLFSIAAGADEDRAAEAVQALGQSRADALPVLRRVLALPKIPRDTFAALYNTNDPACLPDLEIGLWHDDAAHRSEALFTAYCLLETARERAPQALAAIDTRRWGDRMVELFADEELDERQVALTSLGLLRDARHLPLLTARFAAAEDEDEAGDLVEAIGWMHVDEARAWLEQQLAAPRSATACLAAVALARDPGIAPHLHEACCDVMLRKLFADDGDHAWCEAREELSRGPAGRARLLSCIANGDDEQRRVAAECLAYEAGREEPSPLREWLQAAAPTTAAFVLAVAAAMQAEDEEEGENDDDDDAEDR